MLPSKPDGYDDQLGPEGVGSAGTTTRSTAARVGAVTHRAGAGYSRWNPAPGSPPRFVDGAGLARVTSRILMDGDGEDSADRGRTPSGCHCRGERPSRPWPPARRLASLARARWPRTTLPKMQNPSADVGLGVVAGGRAHQGVRVPSTRPSEDGVDGRDRLLPPRAARSRRRLGAERCPPAGVPLPRNRSSRESIRRTPLVWKAEDSSTVGRPRLQRDEVVEQARDLDEVAESALRLRVLVVLPGLEPLAVRGHRRGPARVVPHVELVVDPSRVRHGCLPQPRSASRSARPSKRRHGADAIHDAPASFSPAAPTRGITIAACLLAEHPLPRDVADRVYGAVIIGGGVVGLAAAWHLLCLGCRPVAVVSASASARAEAALTEAPG